MRHTFGEKKRFLGLFCRYNRLRCHNSQEPQRPKSPGSHNSIKINSQPSTKYTHSSSRFSNYFIFQQEEDNQKPGRRVVQGQSANDIFSEGLGMDTNGDRKKPEPAPFLTEDNAVNTNGRRGGFVEKTDCYMESEVWKYGFTNRKLTKFIKKAWRWSTPSLFVVSDRMQCQLPDTFMALKDIVPSRAEAIAFWNLRNTDNYSLHVNFKLINSPSRCSSRLPSLFT